MVIIREPKYLTEEQNLAENLKIEEMGATLRKKRTGLPVNLFLDDARGYRSSGHWKRIKFQADKGDSPNTRTMIPMSIADDPQILVKNPKMSLSSKDIEQIKIFVKLNKDLLLQLSDAQIDIIEFVNKMKTV